MPLLRILLFTTLLAHAVTIVGCRSGGTNAEGSVGSNYIILESDPGDYIGQKQSYTYTQETASLSVTASGGLLTVNVNGDERDSLEHLGIE